jgi:hypothetical protein
MTRFLASVVTALALVACAASPEAPVAKAPALAEEGHPHELHLPPVGPSVHVTLDGKGVDVPLANVPHEGTLAPLVQLWKAAYPNDDLAALHFDLTGSDGFHPASRPPCARLLTGAEVNAARIDVVSHDVSFDSTVQLPGCYRVKAVVSMDATR